VNIASYKQGGSNLGEIVGSVGLALGTQPLTINEQATMLSTLSDNGVYHTAHIVKYWQLPDGPKTQPIMQTRGVFDPTNAANNAALDSQVQYAMSMTTVDGTGTGASTGLGNRPIIAKTGTSGVQSAFFIGAIPQYSLVVGIFTESQSDKSTQTLVPLGGGGFGGYWPAKIWNTFALSQFVNLPVENFQNAVFSGTKWNQIGKLPKKKTTCTFTIHGHKITIPLTGKNKNKKCNQVTPTPTPTPTPTQTQLCHGHKRNCLPTPTPTTSSTFGFPTQPASPTATPTNTTTGIPSGTATATPTNTTTGPGNGATATANGVQAGLAAGGVLTVLLPGSLLWTTMSRRRRRRRKGTAE
jgi:membrane peptidoglycan carboxypeptidase